MGHCASRTAEAAALDFSEACASGRVEVALALIPKLANGPDTPLFLPGCKGKAWRTGLGVAAGSGRDGTCCHLARKGGDVDLVDGNRYGLAPLHYAVDNNNLSTAECLVTELGANVDQPSGKLQTRPLHLATGPSMAKLLVGGLGADPNHTDIHGLPAYLGNYLLSITNPTRSRDILESCASAAWVEDVELDLSLLTSVSSLLCESTSQWVALKAPL